MSEDNICLVLSGQYQIGSENNWRDLLNDTHCLLGSAAGLLLNEADDAGSGKSEALYGIVYLVQLGMSAASRAHELAVAELCGQAGNKEATDTQPNTKGGHNHD